MASAISTIVSQICVPQNCIALEIVFVYFYQKHLKAGIADALQARFESKMDLTVY